MKCPKCKRMHEGNGYLCQYCLEEMDLKLQRDAKILSELAGIGHLLIPITVLFGIIGLLLAL